MTFNSPQKTECICGSKLFMIITKKLPNGYKKKMYICSKLDSVGQEEHDKLVKEHIKECDSCRDRVRRKYGRGIIF